MVQPNQLKDASLKVAAKAVRRTTETIEQTLRDIPDSVVSTARIIISAEERLRQRIRSLLRVAVATLFLGISGLISLGANVTMAFAKKVSPESSTRVRRSRGHLKARYHLRHSGKLLHHEMTARHGSALHAKHSLHGVASWYGKEFNHRRTASGVRFDTHAMMAAHRTLPFGTKVRVTNLKNHKSCVVEITDRGPYARNRVIDLSYAAAQKIGMAQTGTADVQIEVINGTVDNQPDIASEPETATPAAKPVFDRIPAFPNRALAAVVTVPDYQEADDDSE